MSSPIEISNGRETVKNYAGISRGKTYYQLSFYRAGRRERRTFTDKQKAKREATVILGQRASNTMVANDAMTVSDIETLAAARTALEGIGIPVHLAVEGFAGAVRQLGQPADPFVALREAVAFYLKHHPVGFKRLTLGEIMQAYVDSRKRIGLSKGRIGTVESIFRVMRKRFAAGTFGLPSREEVVAWLEAVHHHPGTKNSYLRTLKAFAKWALKERLVKPNPPSLSSQVFCRHVFFTRTNGAAKFLSES